MLVEKLKAKEYEMKNELKENEIIRKKNGFLYIIKDGKEVRVELQACFPWTHPVNYLSLKDSEGVEQLLISDLKDLSEASGKAVRKAMSEAGFCFRLTDIKEVETEFELRAWHVMTEQGERKFQTKLLDWPRQTPGGGLLISDVHGDLYFIEEPKKLSEKAQKILWAFTD